MHCADFEDDGAVVEQDDDFLGFFALSSWGRKILKTNKAYEAIFSNKIAQLT